MIETNFTGAGEDVLLTFDGFDFVTDYVRYMLEFLDARLL